MQLIDVPTIQLPKWDTPVWLHHFTDLHFGALGCDEKKIVQDIEAVQEGIKRGEKHYWLLGGDNINGIGPQDRRHDDTAVAPRFQKFSGGDLFRRQVIAVAELFQPIAEYGLFIGAGNHEDTVCKKSDYNPGADLAERLNLPYAGYSAGFRLRLQHRPKASSSSTVLGYWHHGWGSGRSKGSKANLGVRLQEIVNADLYLTGHVHEPVLMPEEELSLSRKGKLKLVARDKLLVVGASYLKTHPTTEVAQVGGQYDKERAVRYDYGEKAGFRPVVIGHVGVKIQVARISSGSRKTRREAWRTHLRLADFR